MSRQRMSNWKKLLSFLAPKSGVARWAFLLLAALGVFLLAASTVTVLADSRHRGEMFPNTVVLGIDVTGMTREEAVARVKEEAVAPLMTPLTLSFRGRQWVIDPRELNLHVDAEALVDLAYRTGWERSVFERALRRAFNRPLDINIGLEYSLDRDLLTRKLNAVAAEIYCEVVNASLNFDFSTGKLTFHPSRDGLRMDVEATLRVVEEALLSPNRIVEPVVAVTPPSLKSEDVQTVLVVDIMGNTLKWYNKDTLIKTYYVATGEPKYPTPLGKFYIIRKEANPVWINPNTEWSKNMPPRIEPGPDNPLGARALVTSAAGGTVLIHGTKNLVPGLHSHGCIRMANWAIIELFDHVNVGTPVFIWTSKPVPLPPPEEGPPVGPEDPGLGATGNSGAVDTTH
ncbi:L,D-transpeptidase/peptidoglycan binding protein [Candidatus Solincola tengchongensis]|uniref:L,D-transpeptidase family protein n=1 Tax=Candidatus Solincola tengchongensis TaxID=2900693 RepID=UPI00257CF7A0|nr:L,D-transpeptidase/peptidoglycan binding protein [Candidatus Solincola tengchongensis]